MAVAASSPVERIADQIRLIATSAKLVYDAHPDKNEWVIQAIANYLASNGTTSILDLKQYVNTDIDLSFFYDQKTAHVYVPTVDPVELANAPSLKSGYSVQAIGVFKNLFTNLYEGSVKYWVYLIFTKDGYPVFLVRGEFITGQWNDFVKIAVFVIGSSVGFAFPALGATIGNAIMGAEFAAAYPALATAIGNACVSTALSGGDVKAGVTGAVSGFAGGQVGNVVASASDSAIIGTVAAAATKAAIAGGDIEKAVAQSLASQGIKAVDIGSLLTSEGPKMDDYFTDEQGVMYGVDADGDLAVVDFVDDMGVGYATDADGDLMVIDTPSYADLTQPVYSPGGPTAPVAGPSTGGVVSTAGGVNLTDLAVAGLKIVAAWNAAGQPPIRASTGQATANSNGTVTQRSANGQQIVTRMTPGNPYLTADGSLVTNNGDGTYTTVRANGTSAVSRYPATGVGTGIAASLGVNNQTLLIGGAALLGILLLRPARR